MNILDEDISVVECERLRARKIHFRRIGVEIGLVKSKGLGALVHFENCPSEDIEFAPPGF